MSKFLPTTEFNWIDPKDFDLNKYTRNSSKRCLRKVDLEYSKKLHKLHNDCSLALDKIEIKREMLSDYLIADLYSIFIDNVSKISP